MKRLAPRISMVMLVLAGWLLLTANGCGGGGSSAVDLQIDSAEGFTLQLLDESLLDGAAAGDFSIAVDRQAAGVQVSVRVTDARRLKACYFVLSYDAGRYDPLAGRSTGLLSGTAPHEPGEQSSLELAVLTKPGSVHYGEVLTDYRNRDGFSGEGVLATVRFALRPFTPRQASMPPVNDASGTEAHWDPTSQALSWRYFCTGDYDQNSEVGVTDLTPLGANFGAKGPFDPESALAVVDGDSNGELNVSDITPIGANFARRVQGYEVYAGPTPDSLPSANDEPTSVAPIGFVPFGDHIGNPLGERLRFFFEHPEPDPDQIVWVRPVDEEAQGTPSTPQQPRGCSWQLRNVSAFATVDASMNYCSLAVIGGLPAVLYADSDEEQLVYQRALDPTGQVWASEVVVSDSASAHFASSLAEVAGHPAVSHHDSAGGVYFARAADPAGTTWGTPVQLASTAAGGWDCHLWLVDGHPAVCYQDLSSQQLMYVRADDLAGEAWGTPQVLADLGSDEAVAGSFSTPAVVAGHPAVAFHHPGTAELRYVRAQDPLGSTWSMPATVSTGADVGRYASLCEVDGFPAISYLDDSGLAYVRAGDEAGSTWMSPLSVDTRFGAVAHLDTCLAVVRGQPAISYYSGPQTSDLQYVRALNPLGTAWGTPEVVESADSVGRSTRLMMVDESSAISYLDETSSQVKFAICFDEVNFPPVAMLDAYPSRAEMLEEITFDSTRSYDPHGAIEGIDWDMDGDGIFEDSMSSEPVRYFAFDQAGVYLVRVRVVDGQGAEAIAETTVVVGEPGQPPQAELTADPLDAAINESVHFDAAGSSDPDGAIELYEWDLDGDGDFEVTSGPLPTIDYEYSESGIFNAAVKATDDTGLFDIDTVCINVASLNQRPVAVLTGSPTSGNPSFTVYLDGSQSYDPDGTIVRYEWDLDGDGAFEIDGDTNAYWQWLCEQPGDHRVKLRVTDNLGAQDTTWMLCSGNHYPVAKIAASPTSGTCPFTVTLDGSASYDTDGTIVAWGWDLFNDGTYDETGTGTPTSWQFSMIWSGPVKVRLRVKDSMGGKGDAVVTIHGTKGWYVTTLDPVGWAGWFNSLADINGAPGIAYYEYQSRSLKYIRSTNPLGVGGWQTPANLGAIADPGVAAYSVDLALIDGSVPGIGFCGCKSGNPTYAVAKNSEGTQWNPFVTAVPGGAGPGLGLLDVAGKPAIATHMVGVKFYPASNDLGTAWKQPVLVSKTQPLYGYTCPLIIVNGNPALCYEDTITQGGNSLGAMLYVRAIKPDGSEWGSPVVMFDETEGGGGDLALAVIDGRPAVAFVASPGYFEVRYKRSSDQNGTAWTTPSVLIQQGGRTVLGLVTIDGRPAIGLVTCSEHDVMYFRANDATGSSWPAGQLIDSTDSNIGWGSFGGDMISLNGHPAMSYCHSVNTALKYAVLE